jgi:tRNA threonylcarbamoyl adenosine modification protein (Sua5/YciO/YrdC/YwlC family)
MSQFFYIHPENPQPRLINQAVEIVRKGGVIVYPTDSGYALGCKIEDKGAMERICRIRQLPDGHNFTLMCRDLSELSTYAFVDNVAFRLIKNNTPGNYTFILKGTKEVPRRLLQENAKPSACVSRRIRLHWRYSIPLASRCYLPHSCCPAANLPSPILMKLKIVWKNWWI